MGLFDCAGGGGKQSGKNWAKDRKGLSPAAPFMRSSQRMSRGSLFASNASLGKQKNLDIESWRMRVLKFIYHGEGKEDIRVLEVPYRVLGYSTVTDFIVDIPPALYEQLQHQKPDEGLYKDDKVIWQRDGIAEPAIFKWTGLIGDQKVMGLQLDRKKVVPFGVNDGKGLFYCKPGHRAMVPSNEVIPYRKFLRSFLGVVPRKDSMRLDLSGASSSKGNPAKKEQEQSWKQGDHVYLNQEKKWATIQWTGRIGSDTVVDIVYDQNKPTDRRVVSPDEPPISRSMSMADFVNEVGQDGKEPKPGPSKAVSAAPSPSKVKTPSAIEEDEVFVENAAPIKKTQVNDDSALEDEEEAEEDDSDSDSLDDDDSDDDSDTEDEAEPMTPPPQKPMSPPIRKMSPPIRKMSIENITLYDDNLRQIENQERFVGKPEEIVKEKKKDGFSKPAVDNNEVADSRANTIDNRNKSSTRLNFGFLRKSNNKKKKEEEPPVKHIEEIYKTHSLPRIQDNREKVKKKRGFFRRRASSSDAEDLSKSESHIAKLETKLVEVEQHEPPPRRALRSVGGERDPDRIQVASQSSYYDSDDYYRPVSPNIKDTGIQMSNAIMKLSETKGKDKDRKESTTKSLGGSLSSFFFPKRNRSSSKDGLMDSEPLTTTEIDIEEDNEPSPVAVETPIVKTAPKEATTTMEQEANENVSDSFSSSQESLEAVQKPVVNDVVKEEEIIDNAGKERHSGRGKSLLSFFSKKPKSSSTSALTHEVPADVEDTEELKPEKKNKKDVVVENPYVNVPFNDTESESHSEVSTTVKEKQPPLRKGSKGRSSFQFAFSRKKKSVTEPIEYGENAAAAQAQQSKVQVQPQENNESSNEVVLRKKRPSEDVENQKSNEKEKRSSFRNSFTRRFSLPRRRKSSAERDKPKNSEEKVEQKAPEKPKRPKSLYSSSNKDNDDDEHQPLSKTKSASVIVDIQPWYSRRAPKKNLLDTSYSTPLDNNPDSNQNDDSQNFNDSRKSTTPDSDVPKHRMFTTPSLWGRKKAKKSEDDVFLTDENDAVTPTEEPTRENLKKSEPNKRVDDYESPSSISSSVIYTAVTPTRPSPNTTYIDVTSPTPIAEAPVIATPLVRVASGASTTYRTVSPAPLIRLATPVGYGQKRNVEPLATRKELNYTAESPVSSDDSSVQSKSPPTPPPKDYAPRIPPKTSVVSTPKSPPPVVTPSPTPSKSPPPVARPLPPLPKSPPPMETFLPFLPKSPPPPVISTQQSPMLKAPAPVVLPLPPLPKSPPPLSTQVQSSTTPSYVQMQTPTYPTSPSIVDSYSSQSPCVYSPPPETPPPIHPRSPNASAPSTPTKILQFEQQQPSKVLTNQYATPTRPSSFKYNERQNPPTNTENISSFVAESVGGVPVAVTTPVSRASSFDQSPRTVSLTRTPSIDRPPPLPAAPPPSRAVGPPVCVTPPTPKTPTTPAPLKSALKQRKEIEMIPQGLKIADRVLWYNGGTPIPGIVRKLYKDGTDKYTAVVKFDHERLQAPLTLVREGDSYEVTVEELLPTEVFNNGEDSKYPPTPTAMDKDSDDGLLKSKPSLKAASVQFNPSVEESTISPRGTITSESSSVGDDGVLPPAFIEEELNIACGLRRGIQTCDKSSCLETILFSMFYTTNAFDSCMLFENPDKDQQQTKEAKRILKKEIVKPLRETGFVSIDAMKRLRTIMQPFSPDMNSLSTSAETMLFILFERALNLKEFITYSSDVSDYHHQILLNYKDHTKCVTMQSLLESSLELMDNFKLKMIPTPGLILEMPRSQHKLMQYDAVIPNLTLNIAHLLENGPKLCLCGMVAKFECRICITQTRGSSSIVYCESCRGMSDQIHHQLGHNPVLSPIIQLNGLMDLVAVVCVKDGHYVSFVKCGSERLSPWLFYDSVQNEPPKVSVEQHLGMWLDRLEKYPGKYRDAFAHALLAQLLTDNHICIYQPRCRGSYV